MTEPRITIHCNYCRSQDVRRDALVSWDVETQKWMLEEIYDLGICNECRSESRLVERNAETGAPMTRFDLFYKENNPMTQRTMAQMRKELGDDLYDIATNDRNIRSSLVDRYIASLTDEDVKQAWLTAGLGEIDTDKED